MSSNNVNPIPSSPTNQEATISDITPPNRPHVFERESSADSEVYHDIDIIIFGIKEEIGDFLDTLQVYAGKRTDGHGRNLYMSLGVKFDLQQQTDLAGCRSFISSHGKSLEISARCVFAEDAARWEEDDLEDVAEESVEPAQQHEESGAVVGADGDSLDEDTIEESEDAAQQLDEDEFVASEEDATRVQQMFAHEAMQVAQRLGTLQTLLLGDLPLLSDKDLAHKPTCSWSEMVTGEHWSEVLLSRLKGERYW
jgi:hypothetical protein